MGWRCMAKILKCIMTSTHGYRTKIKIDQVRTVVNLSYKIIGDNDLVTDPNSPPVILLHGLFGSKRDWESIGKIILTLTKRVVVGVDLRNHGDSPRGHSHQYEKMAGDVIQLFKKLSVTRASLIGHGCGGLTAMCTSLMAPQMVAGILVVDMSPIKVPPEIAAYYYKILMVMKDIDFSKFVNVRKAKIGVKKKLRKVIGDEATMRLVLANVNFQRSTGSIDWTCNVDALFKNFHQLLELPVSVKNKNYTGPALFVGGQYSDSIDPDDLPNIRVLFPRAVIIFVPGTGHFVHLDDPKTFLELAIRFIRTNKLKHK